MPARRTSDKRGVRCAFFIGCTHVEPIGGCADGRELIEADQGVATVERWNAEAERLFAGQTARWTAAERTRFRTQIGFPKSAHPAA
jgi:hypothetical protein